jgi:hypothetical protein
MERALDAVWVSGLFPMVGADSGAPTLEPLTWADLAAVCWVSVGPIFDRNPSIGRMSAVKSASRRPADASTLIAISRRAVARLKPP